MLMLQVTLMTILHTHRKFSNKVLEKLECAFRNILKWFFNNAMKANPDKCYFLSSLDMNSKISVNRFDIENTHSQKLLAAIIDRKIDFHVRAPNLCKKASARISAMATVVPFMLLNQRKLIMKAILISQFGYCPLVWINHNKTLNNRINSLHERALRLIYNDFKSSFYQLLEKNNFVTIHQRNLQNVAIEIFKVHSNISPEVMKDVFKIKNHQYNFRRAVCLQRRNVNIALYGTERISFLGAQIGNLVTTNLKCSKSLNEFKKNIRKRTTKECPCRRCKVYVQNLEFT